MTFIELTGHLVCRAADQAAVIRRHLPLHVALTRAEPGCLVFEVHQTPDPLVWNVNEQFVDERAFETHQHRVADSEWGRVTADIERRYAIRGLADE